MSTLNEYYKVMCARYGEEHIMGVFLYGSQNYNLATENSDVDAKAIYIPSLAEIAADKKPISKEFELENGAHIEVKDIRLMCRMWKKQNINFVEILFTDYCVINPMYLEEWNEFTSCRELTARYNVYQTVVSSYWQAKNTIKSEGITGKQYVNAQRLVEFFEKYLGKANLSYKECITVDDKNAEIYKNLKKNCELMSADNPLVQKVKADLDKFFNFIETNKNEYDICSPIVDNFLVDTTVKALRKLG